MNNIGETIVIDRNLLKIKDRFQNDPILNRRLEKCFLEYQLYRNNYLPMECLCEIYNVCKDCFHALLFFESLEDVVIKELLVDVISAVSDIILKRL
jgi:hypothetical protein